MPVEALCPDPEGQLAQALDAHPGQPRRHPLVQPRRNRILWPRLARADALEPLHRQDEPFAQALLAARRAAAVARAKLGLVELDELRLSVEVRGLPVPELFQRRLLRTLLEDGFGVATEEGGHLRAAVRARQASQLVQQPLQLAARAPGVGRAVDEHVAVPRGRHVQALGPAAHEGHLGMAQAAWGSRSGRQPSAQGRGFHGRGPGPTSGRAIKCPSASGRP